MPEEEITKCIIDITTLGYISGLVVFFIISFFILYQSLLKTFGKKIAELATAKELAEIQGKVKHDFDTGLADYNQKLNKEIAEKIEHLKAELDKKNITHQIQYAFLHEERARVILHFYKLIQNFKDLFYNYSNIGIPQNQDERRKLKSLGEEISKSFTDLKSYYYTNRIFFSNDFCDSIDLMLTLFAQISTIYVKKLTAIISGVSPNNEHIEQTKETTYLSKKINNSINQNISNLEKMLREMLNVDDEPSY